MKGIILILIIFVLIVSCSQNFEVNTGQATALGCTTRFVQSCRDITDGIKVVTSTGTRAFIDTCSLNKALNYSCASPRSYKQCSYLCGEGESCQAGQCLSRCGNGWVDIGETCSNCAADVACTSGETCQESTCVSTCTPSDETCDSLDNNCNGIIDEGVCNPLCVEVIPRHNNITANRINLILVGINYNNDAFGSYVQKVIDYNGSSHGLLNIEPYASNKNKFNL